MIWNCSFIFCPLVALVGKELEETEQGSILGREREREGGREGETRGQQSEQDDRENTEERNSSQLWDSIRAIPANYQPKEGPNVLLLWKMASWRGQVPLHVIVWALAVPQWLWKLANRLPDESRLILHSAQNKHLCFKGCHSDLISCVQADDKDMGHPNNLF